MTCYAASGQLFLFNGTADETNFVLNGIAVAALGIGILGQALISTMALRHAGKLIPTWSSNPLNTVLVCIHQGMKHKRNRCLLSVRDIAALGGPVIPIFRQSSMHQVFRSVGRILYFLWSLFVLSLIWAVSVLLTSRFGKKGSEDAPTVSFYGSGVAGSQVNLYGLLIIISFQIWLTLGLHFAELIVNTSRDEAVWRQATTKAGAKISHGPIGSIKAAVLSWQTLLLSGLKSLTHWLFGISISTKGGLVLMNWQGIYFLSAAILVLAIFATIEASRQPKGPQPVAFGHLQTLADLIDVWITGDETMWWGDKTKLEQVAREHHEVRHAGTAKQMLDPIKMRCLYAG